MNIHHKKLLRFSNNNSTLGDRLWTQCQDFGLKQLVNSPTRNEYLLDLVLTDVGNLLKVQVLPELSDHRVVSITLDIVVPVFPPEQRQTWAFHKADWTKLKKGIWDTSWVNMLNPSDPDKTSSDFVQRLSALCEAHVPRTSVTTRTSPHPWLDDTCYAAIEAKCNASSIAERARLTQECSATLSRAFAQYQEDLRVRIRELPRSSKEWWKLNRELLNRKAKTGTIAPLRSLEGS